MEKQGTVKAVAVDTWLVYRACPICHQQKQSLSDVKITFIRYIPPEDKLRIVPLIGICRRRGHILSKKDAQQAWDNAGDDDVSFYGRIDGGQPSR